MGQQEKGSPVTVTGTAEVLVLSVCRTSAAAEMATFRIMRCALSFPLSLVKSATEAATAQWRLVVWQYNACMVFASVNMVTGPLLTGGAASPRFCSVRSASRLRTAGARVTTGALSAGGVCVRVRPASGSRQTGRTASQLESVMRVRAVAIVT